MKDLWTIHGQQYDLSDFVDQHPGGKESILLGRGRDCTAMFESYHPFTDAHRAVLNKHQKNILILALQVLIGTHFTVF